MWYEILPCIGIITAALAAPTVINYQLMKWQQYGNPYRRELYPKMNLDLYQRDMRLSNNPYVIQVALATILQSFLGWFQWMTTFIFFLLNIVVGLENIPDKV